MPQNVDGLTTAHTPGHPCVVCGGTAWTPLPDPGARSMASDFRIVDEPLARQVCDACGLARRMPSRDATTFFETGYGLYAHAPGESRERARQEAYARWIAGSVAVAPARVLDVGCGNGSLLLALREWWPQAELSGCDPSAEAIAHGAAHDVRLWRGTIDELPADVVADVAVTINVIEHTADPLRFLERVRRRLTTEGIAVAVCPDGSRPGVELLFVDHLFSFAPPHLDAMLTRAGFAVIGCSPAPPEIGEFQMVIARRVEADGSGDGGSENPPRRRGLTAERATYLQRWRDLDARLTARMHSAAVCFGAGEAAGLLRAYAPDSWSLVTACTFDGAAGGTFGELPIVPLDAVSADTTLVLGVRPADQPRLIERLQARFARVVAWYDLVRVEHD